MSLSKFILKEDFHIILSIQSLFNILEFIDHKGGFQLQKLRKYHFAVKLTKIPSHFEI